jgi:hypothetical protein
MRFIWPGSNLFFDALFELHMQILEQRGLRAYLMGRTRHTVLGYLTGSG